MDAQQAKHQASARARTLRQKRALWLVYAAAGLATLGAYLGHALTSASILVPLGLVLAVMAIDRRLTPRRVACQIAFSLMPLLGTSAMAGHLAVQAGDSDQAAAILAAHPTEVAKDAAAFAADLHAGTLHAALSEGLQPFARTRNDALGEAVMRTGFALGVAGRADLTSANALFPMLDLWFGERVVLVYSDRAQDMMAARTHAHRVATLGADYQDWPSDRRAAAIQADAQDKTRYQGIVAATCILDDDGRVLSATAVTTQGLVSLHNVPQARPIVDACQASAPARVAPKTAP